MGAKLNLEGMVEIVNKSRGRRGLLAARVVDFAGKVSPQALRQGEVLLLSMGFCRRAIRLFLSFD